MAIFRGPDDWDRLDWRLLQCSPVTLYFSRQVLADDVAWLSRHGYRIHTLDFSRMVDEGDFHAEVSRVLEFPSYYGRNLDAFNDCMSDIDVPALGGAALVFLAFDALYARLPRRCWAILDVVAANSRQFLLTGRRLLGLVQSDDASLVINDVGACPVMVNPAEFGRRTPPEADP